MHVFPRRWLFLGVCSVTLGIGETVVIATDVAFWLRRGDPMPLPLPFISVAKSMTVAAGASMSREGTDTILMSVVTTVLNFHIISNLFLFSSTTYQADLLLVNVTGYLNHTGLPFPVAR